jgi:hypothetical protein
MDVLAIVPFLACKPVGKTEEAKPRAEVTRHA